MRSIFLTFAGLLALASPRFLMAQVQEKVLTHGESVNVASAKQNFNKIGRGYEEAPACVVYSSSGGFQLTISGKNKIHTSNFLKIARSVKAFQSQGICGQIVLSKVNQSPKELILFGGQSLLLDYSRGIETVTCQQPNPGSQFGKCFVMTHPVSAASLFYRDFTLDTSAALLRDDYISLESKYSKILSDIGLCEL
jgi:hypothetical protein